MIENRLEYERMYQLERKLWWYEILHKKVLHQIRKHFKIAGKELRILDAACGTGGLLSFLAENGFKNLTGFDYSRYAVDFSLTRNLDVSFGDLRNADAFRPDQTFDVICCNDALYFLSDQEIVSVLKSFKKRLNQNGLLIVNIHAFDAFSGTHDLAVGSSRRFTLENFQYYAIVSDLQIHYSTYWPFFLSLPIWVVRSWQKYRISKNKNGTLQYDSDVKYPGAFVNNILKGIILIENSILPKAPFGSSLFMVLK
jgi:SAM-dependent methyltransferase